MFNPLKKKMNSKLIFEFSDSEKPLNIEIENTETKISFESNRIIIDFTDFTINEYKIYNCKIKYQSYINICSINVYYEKENYYYILGDGNHSAEIIFIDFVNKSIIEDDCKIKYKGVNYFPKEDFNLSSRKRINLLNINIKDLELPKDLNNKEINFDIKEEKNFLVLISVVNEQKIIGIHSNNPFYEEDINLKESEIIEILENSIKKVEEILKFDIKKNIFDYYEEIDKEKIDVYKNEIFNSYEVEKKISKYFIPYRENLNENEIKIYDLYSEFMLYFPDFEKSMRKNYKYNVNRYSYQYYFSKKSILNFCERLPKNLTNTDMIKLKYAACRCLKILLYYGYAENFDDLFDFLDFGDKNTIYYDSNSFNIQFVNSITEKSEIFPFFLQINSGSSIDLISNNLTSRISMLNESQVKNHLLSTIPKYGIRLKVNSFFNACTFSELKISCFCENSFFSYYLSEDQLKSINDVNYNRRYRLSNLLQHENFGHIKFSLNFYSFYDKRIDRSFDSDCDYDKSQPLSPKVYYKFHTKEEMIEIVKERKINNKIITIGESGIALTTFITRGKYKLMKMILYKSGINFKTIFENPTLMSSEDLTNFIKELELIYNESNLVNEEGDDIEYKSKFDEPQFVDYLPVGIPTIEKFN